ncbi:MAG TPA: hypothetical protein VGI40_26405 [Pirellulaceae bacterium]|jgi:hypothetical protein
MQLKTQQDEIPSLSADAGRFDVLARQGPEMCARRGMLALVIAAGIFNVAALPVIWLIEDSDAIMFIASPTLGVLLAEAGALASWLVWGEGPFLKRLAVHWAIGVILGAGVLSGTAFFNLFDDVPAYAVPTLSLAVQLPLWPFRIYFGWYVEPQGMQGTAVNSQPLKILDIFSGTAIVAVSLALIRVMEPLHAEYVWVNIADASLFVLIASFLLLLPAAFIILRAKKSMTAFGYYFGYVLAIGILPLLLTLMVGPGVEVALGIFLGGFAFAATLAAPLLVWRACGYRLMWGRERR